MDELVKFMKIALGFAEEVLAAGKSPSEELQKLIDIHPKLDEAHSAIDDAMKKKFGE